MHATRNLILKSIRQKADFIITPECSSLFGLNKKQLLRQTTSMKEDIYLNGIKKYEDIKSLFDLPFFPNSIFKYHNLSSTKKIFKIINSSGTTSQLKSKINLERNN